MSVRNERPSVDTDRSIRDRERFLKTNQKSRLCLTVIWARQLVSPQPKLGPSRSRLAERARVDEFDAVGRPCRETSELAIAVLHGVIECPADKPEVDTLDDP